MARSASQRRLVVSMPSLPNSATLGGVAEDGEEDEDEEDILDKFHIYKCQKTATLRAGFPRDAARMGAVEAGQFIEVIEKRVNEAGQSRLRVRRIWNKYDEENELTEQVPLPDIENVARYPWTSHVAVPPPTPPQQTQPCARTGHRGVA